MKLVVQFDSKPGPLRFALPGMEKGAFRIEEIDACALALTVLEPVPETLRFFLRSDMPANLAQVYQLERDCAALPWPPRMHASEPWRKEPAAFSVMGPAATDDGWSVKLTLRFNDRRLPAEFLVVCDCPCGEMSIVQAPDSPRGAGCLNEPGPTPNSILITVRPSSLSDYDHVALRLIARTVFRIESVERLFRQG